MTVWESQDEQGTDVQESHLVTSDVLTGRCLYTRASRFQEEHIIFSLQLWQNNCLSAWNLAWPDLEQIIRVLLCSKGLSCSREIFEVRSYAKDLYDLLLEEHILLHIYISAQLGYVVYYRRMGSCCSLRWIDGASSQFQLPKCVFHVPTCRPSKH